MHGLLQFTCGLPTPDLSNHRVSAVSRAVTVGDVWERRRNLRSWLLPPGNDFQLHGLTDLFGGCTVLPPHTWLQQLSRHAAIELRDYSSRRPGEPPPAGFPEALDWHQPRGDGTAPWTHFLRVQRARDDSNRFTAETDCNDYLIRWPTLPAAKPDVEAGSLWELQLFFCEFLAQRRGAIFASHVSERIYSIWLPPGVISLDDGDPQRDEDACFAVLPVVNVVRRPYGLDWRYAMSVTALFVPWRPADRGKQPAPREPRSMRPQEIVDLIASTGGNSTYLRDSGGLRWTLSEDSPLCAYLKNVTSDQRRDFCRQYGGPDKSRTWPSQTLRHWIELLLMTVAEVPKGQDEREDDRLLPEQQQADDRILSDEVLRCLRVNGIWSAVLLTDSFSFCTGTSRLADDRWWPGQMNPFPDTIDAMSTGIPDDLKAVFDPLARRDRGFLPAPDDRIDVLSTGGKAHITWRIPRENIMITAYSRSADDFPSFSSLYLVGWFVYMAVGVTCAWQTMYSLTHDTDRLRDVAELSQLGHDRIMDLEDVYEFDVAWPAYAQFYRHVRELLGVDREYAEIKERLDLLFRFAQVEQRTKEDRLRDEEIRLGTEEQRLSLTRSHTVEYVAAVIAFLVLLVTVLTLLIDVYKAHFIHVNVVVISFASAVAAGVVGFIWLALRIRKIDNDRETARLALARLARSPTSPS